MSQQTSLGRSNSNPSGRVPVQNALLAGSLSGMIAKSLVAPVDRVRIIYQASSKPFTFKKGLDTAEKIVKNSGYKGLWRGNTSSMLRVGPYCAIQFSVHEQLKSWFGVRTYEEKVAQPWLSLLAGCLAGMTAIVTTYPLDVMRARMATDMSYKSTADVLKRAILSKDVKYSLYRGMIPALLGNVPLTGASFFVYELFKTRYFAQAAASSKKDRLSLLVENLVLGTSVSYVGQTAIYPLDVVRRRMQTNPKEDMNMGELLVHIAQKEGIRGLYKGITLSWLKLPVVMVTSLVTFDFSYYMLNKYRQ